MENMTSQSFKMYLHLIIHYLVIVNDNHMKKRGAYFYSNLG